ncbi:MAG: methyltransferase domain-containing protein [Chitinispirillaceae bacterium]
MISQSRNTGYYVDSNYLRQAASITAPVKKYSYSQLQCRSDSRILDAGCGPGIDTAVLSESFSQEGTTVGIDIDLHMVKDAYARSARNVLYNQSSICQLPFKTGYFDACRSERVFQHLPSPEDALREMIRVTRKGGRIVVVDTDHSAMSVDTPEVDIEWRLRRIHTERFQHGYAGRSLYRLFRKAGMSNVEVKSFVIHTTSYPVFRFACEFDSLCLLAMSKGVVTEKEIGFFKESLERNDTQGTFFGTMNMMVVSGSVME